MRTELANCAGGSGVIMSAKSQQDVEAAFAIAQLSEMQPRGMDFYARTSSERPLTTGCGSGHRYSHMRTAVMPRTSSRVEKAAIKRKFDSSLNGDLPELYKQRRILQDAVDPVLRAIEFERNTFLTARRTDPADDDRLVGRFVRTSDPTNRDDIQLYVKVSDDSVSQGVFAANTSSKNDIPPPALSPYVNEHLYLSHTVSRQPRDVVYSWSDPRTATSKQQIPAVLMSYEESVPKQLPRRGTMPLPARKSDVNRRNRRDRASTLLSTYYSLGQSAASQFLSPSVVTSSPSAQLTSRSFESHVDSCTMNKVRRGEFGVLKTLRHFTSQLRRRSEPTQQLYQQQRQQSDDDVAVDLSVRKQQPAVERGGEHSSDAAAASISAWYHRTSRSCGSSPSVRAGEVHEHLRPTAVDRDRLQRQGTSYTSLSLPCSPYDENLLLRHQRHSAAANDNEDSRAGERTLAEGMSPDEAVPEVIPDSQLPLKKRRLHFHQEDDPCDQQQQSAVTDVKLSSSDNDRNAAASAAAASSPAQDSEVNERDAERLLCPDEDGDLPLHMAVVKGTSSAVDRIISVMLSHGVSIDYCNDRQQTALHLAVLTDQPVIVRQLLDYGASSNIVDLRGQTCLHIAVQLDNTACLRQLLQHSRLPVNINAVSHDGVTALQLAVDRLNTNAAQCLLSAGALIDVKYLQYPAPVNCTGELKNIRISELPRTKPVPAHSGGSAVYSMKCSTDLLQLLSPAINHHHLPACCPTG